MKSGKCFVTIILAVIIGLNQCCRNNIPGEYLKFIGIALLPEWLEV